MDAIDKEILLLEDQFPGPPNRPSFAQLLWVPNVFQGEVMHECAKPGANIMSADICTRLLALQRLGVIECRRFNPSHSARAFIGLRGSRRITKPCPETAHAFEWEVVDSSIGRRLLGLKNPATDLGRLF